MRDIDSNDKPADENGTVPRTLGEKLMAFGLDGLQVDALIREVPVINHELRERSRIPSITTQREALQRMVDAGGAAITAYDEAMNLLDHYGLAMVLRKRLDDAAEGSTGDYFDSLLEHLHVAQRIAEIALNSVPQSQKHAREPTLPIRLVHQITRIKPSKAPRSRFRRIVELLYAEAGFPHQSAEAAIANYIKGSSR